MTDDAVTASLERVSVAFGKQWALSDVSAEFPAGAVGLLGPNGAGKSTMLKALLGLIRPDHGTLRVLGLDVATAALEIHLGAPRHGEDHVQRDVQCLRAVDVAVAWWVGDDRVSPERSCPRLVGVCLGAGPPGGFQDLRQAAAEGGAGELLRRARVSATRRRPLRVQAGFA